MRRLFLTGRGIFLFLTFVCSQNALRSQIDFVADTTEGCNPLVVNFTALVPGAVSYSWNLGNGTFSIQQNPGVTYVNSGSYDITLTAAFANGNSLTLTKSGYIEVFQNPVPDFVSNIQTLCAGTDVQFTDLSTAGSSPIVSWIWDFGDGFTSMVQNPLHTYNNSGTFTVTLVTRDANGCETTFQKPNYIQVDPTPNADFIADNALGCNAPFPVKFTSLGPGTNATHQWTFGPAGASSAFINPAYTYNSVGSFTVTHIVSYPAGCADTVVKANYINIGSGSTSIQVSDSLVCKGEAVSFFCGAGPGSSVNWNFGITGANSNICNPTFSYNTPGIYNVTAFIIDTSGCQFTANKVIQVSTPPNIDFNATDTVLCEAPHTTQFNNLSTGAVSYQWFFGDGLQSSMTNPLHTYPNLPVSSATGQPYFFSVTLVGYNADGCPSSLVKPTYIKTGQTVATFSADPSEGCAPLTVSFQDESLTPSTVTSWFWDFGDMNTSTMQNPVHTYQDTGRWDITLIINTLHGCTDTVVASKFVKAGEKPIAHFIPDTVRSCASDPIKFINLSIGADSASWTFSDGGSSINWEPSYQFSDTGYMSVTLVAFDRGCPDTLTLDSIVYIDAPIALFTPQQIQSCTLPFTVDFVDNSLDAHNWVWDFGDNSPGSTLQNPTHTYTQEGDFSVSLIVSNDSTGCSYTRTGTVRIQLVHADFSVDTTFGCNPLLVQFSDSSYNPVNWLWSFGDGNVSTAASPTHVYDTPGSYNLSLTVWNSIGCFDDTVITDMFQVYEPVIDFMALDSSGCAPFTVPFINQTTSLAPVVTWDWNLGLPTANSALQDPVFTYTQPGPYTITLTATDSLNCSSTLIKPFYVFVSEPIADFQVMHPVNCRNNPIPFINNSTGAGLSYQWNFGDGNTSGAVNPVHTYSQNGVYDVMLSITDFQGCTDTLFLPGYITIADPMADFVADTTSADCPPLLVNFSSNMLSAHGFSSWNWDFGDTTSSVGQNPSHVYIDVGDFDVRMIATAPSGCADTVFKPGLIQIDGPSGDFTFSPDKGCPGTQVTFNSINNVNIASWTWDFNNGALGTGQDTVYTYLTPGVFLPKLIIKDSSGCEVIVQTPNTIEIYPAPTAAFTVSNSTLCDTGTISFQNQSTAATLISQWQWDFGPPGATSALANPSFTYTQPGQYDVRLIATTVDGCRDTALIPAAVTVNPSPVIAIAASDSANCIPFATNFQGISFPGNSAPQTWNWDFGVLPVATSSLPNPSFSYQNAGSYLVNLQMTDVNGCSGEAQLPVEAFPLPSPDFSASDSFGCAPALIQFTDQTIGAVDWKWNFGDGSPFAFLEDPAHVYQQDGQYTVTLQVWDVEGCTDSLVKPQYINLGHPTANFQASGLVVCPNEDIQFQDLSLSDTLISFWQWDFGDGVGTSFLQDPVYAYTQSGVYDVRLIVRDVFGCGDTIIFPQYIRVLEDVQPESPVIRYVSVLSDSEIELFYRGYANTRNDFDRYVIYRQNSIGGWDSVGTVTNPLKTRFIDTGLSTTQSSYCYKIQTVNYCNNRSLLSTSETHCSMLLTTTSQVDQIAVNWTPYTGWNAVDRYQLYRVKTYSMSNAVLIATLPPNTTEFVDTDMFCYDAVTYRVEAIISGDSLSSLSNIRRDLPMHFGPPNPMNMTLATVVADSFVQVSWGDIPQGQNLVQVIVEKNDGTGFKVWHTQAVGDPLQQKDDPDTDVDRGFYQYRVQVLDTCGDYTPAGRIATSIHLTAVKEQGSVSLRWNPYESWASGVERYTIEVFNESLNQFELVGTAGGSERVFIDRKTELEQENLCYRVTAWEAFGVLSSVSNEACVKPDPKMYFPNAFSPNYDLINDVFLIKGAFLDNFQLAIFNRWGEKLFESNNISEGWDGTYKGKPVQEGVYIFRVSGIGYDGTLIERAGTVTLMR